MKLKKIKINAPLKFNSIEKQIINYQSQYLPTDDIHNIINSGINTHIIKSQTGSGATHSLFMSNKKIILISPNVSLVKDKQIQFLNPDNNFKTKKACFLYADSNDSLNPDFATIDDSCIIMGTTDQFVYNQDKLLNYFANGFILVIDQFHVQLSDSLYRDAMGYPFISLIKTAKKYTSVYTITATPPEFIPPYLADFKVVKFNKVNAIKKPVIITDNKDQIDIFINRNILIKDSNIILYSNSYKKIKDVIRRYSSTDLNLTFGFLVGDMIKTKLIASVKMDIEYTKNKNYDILFVTTAGMQGISIQADNPYIIVHSKYNTNYGTLTFNKVIQAIGRTRQGYIDCMVVLDDFIDGGGQIEQLTTNNDNRIAAEKEIEFNKYLQSEKANFQERIYRFNFQKKNNIYKTFYQVQQLDKEKLPLQKIIENLLYYYDKNEFDSLLEFVLSNAYIYQKFPGISPKMIFAFLFIKIVKEGKMSNISQFVKLLNHKKDQRNIELIKKLLLSKQLGILDFNNFEIYKKSQFGKFTFRTSKNAQYYSRLFNIYFDFIYPNKKVINKIKKYFAKKYVKIDCIHLQMFREIIQKYFDKLNLSENVKTKILKNIYKGSKNYYITGGIQVYDNGFASSMLIRNKLKQIDENLDFEKIIQKMLKIKVKETLQYSRQIGGLYLRKFTDGFMIRGSRQFNAITFLSINLLKIISPVSVVQFDIKSAYPSFLIQLFMINKGFSSDEIYPKIKNIEVYETIMTNEKISRKKAKIKFNKFLNSNFNQIDSDTQIQFFRNCGFDDVDLKLLFKIKGQDNRIIYDLFSFIEKNIIDDFRKIIEIDEIDNEKSLKIRRHDSLIIFDNVSKVDYQELVQTKINISEKFIFNDIDFLKNENDFFGILDGELIK